MKTKLLLFFFTFLIIKANAQQEIYSFLGYPSSTLESTTVHFKDKLFFEAYTSGTGREVWISDGTSANTTILKDINIGTGSSLKSSLKRSSAILNNRLYFIAKDGDAEAEIWTTDGTTDGTIKLTSFLNGRETNLTTVGAFVFFTIKNDDDTLEVWKTDGTTMGTIFIDRLPAWSKTSFQGKCNNTFIFTFQPYGTNLSRVWRSDGTSTGTFPITEEVDGNGSGLAYGDGSAVGGLGILTQYIEHNNKLYFVTRNSLFETDGTLENTKSVARINNYENISLFFSDIIEVNNNLYLMFLTKTHNISILKFDSATNEINSVYENTSSNYFSPSNFLKTNSSLLFTSSNSAGNTSLVSLNLANNVVSNVAELTLASDNEMRSNFSYYINSLIQINQDEYFIHTARDKNNKRKGWILNNKLQTVENVSDLDGILEPVIYKDYLYYAKDNKLWKYVNNLSTPLFENKSSLVFYPNPSKDFINVQTENDNQIESIQIFDLNGRLVNDKTDFNTNKIDISKLNQGSYLLKAKVDGTVISKKIIKY